MLFFSQDFEDELLAPDDDIDFDGVTNAGDSPSSGRSSVCSIPGSPVSHRSGRALRKEGQRDLHSSSFSVSSKLLFFYFLTIQQTVDMCQNITVISY